MTTVRRRAEVDGPQIKTVKAEGQWKGQFRTDLDVRDFRFVAAEPEKLGGNNEWGVLSAPDAYDRLQSRVTAGPRDSSPSASRGSAPTDSARPCAC